MYVDTDTIIKLAELIAALSAVIGCVIAVYKIYAQIKRQEAQIQTIMSELYVIDMSLKGALEGLIENGCNGPCKDALAALDRHIVSQAHKTGGNQ